ncbi:hypothetical protein ACFS6H_04475 [Terrimonas rubra]|uniref:Outer membrane protein beta-barrel domain-containing protein n=1 Tax=Terrimonas rubra TaxID=1035890 RepID=A0ABW6A3C7_9BACT
MNKIFKPVFLLLACCFTLMLNGQFKKGTKLVNAGIGSALFHSSTIDYGQPVDVGGILNTQASIKNFDIKLAPGFGWFVTPQVAVGGRIGLNYLSAKRNDKDQNSGNIYSKDNSSSFFADLNAFSRYYFTTEKTWLPFAEATAGLGFGSSKGDGFFYKGSEYKDVTDTKSSGDFAINAGLLVGITKMLGKQVGLDIAAGYKYTRYKNEVRKTTERDVNMDGSIDETLRNLTTQKSNRHGLQISVGLQIFLHKN